MSSSGPRYPTAAASQGSGVSWSNPTNVFAKDDTAATATLIEPRAMSTTTLFASAFGFSIDSAATINGIQVQLRRQSVGDGVFTTALELTDTTTGNNGSDQWMASYVYETYGSATDLWGRSWTPADINDSGFGVSIVASLSPLGSSSANISLDVITVTVWYTEVPEPCRPKTSSVETAEWNGVTSGSAKQDLSSVVWDGVISGDDRVLLSGAGVSGDGEAIAVFATAEWSGIVYDETAEFAESAWNGVVAADESEFADVAWDGVCH